MDTRSRRSQNQRRRGCIALLNTARFEIWLCAAVEPLPGAAPPLSVHLPAEAPAHVRVVQNRIYANLKWMLLPDGGFVYPNRQDWELFRNLSWLGKHVLMAVWAQDPDAWTWVPRGLEVLEKMQARSTAGAVFHPGESFFASTQHDLFRSLANVWLSLQLAGEIRDAPRARVGVRRWDSAKVILRRSPDAIHTVSWGAKIMAQCVPCRLDRVVSPHERNGVGQVLLAGGRAPLSLRLQRADVREGTNGFEARLTVDHGEAVRAELEFRSEADGAFLIAEKLVVLTNLATGEIATGLVGILNNPHWIYEQGRRRVAVDGQSMEVASGCGQPRQWEAASRIKVDNAFEIVSPQPLRAAYLAAEGAERGRVTDCLILNYLPGNRTWFSGAVISDYQAVIRAESENGWNDALAQTPQFRLHARRLPRPVPDRPATVSALSAPPFRAQECCLVRPRLGLSAAPDRVSAPSQQTRIGPRLLGLVSGGFG